MTEPAVLSPSVSGPRPVLRDPDQLRDVLGIDMSDEQMRIVTAPLEPGVVVAGAGSGKTTVMTARVVWLVGTGRVRPCEFLGLTFTNKAAGELDARIRGALDRLASATRTTRTTRTARFDEELAEPTVSTYHAYAGGLLTEHGLRLGFEPGLRVVSDATRFQLAARVVTGSSHPVERLSGNLSTVVTAILSLDAQLQDHLVSVQQLREHDRALRETLQQQPFGKSGKPLVKINEAVATSCERDELLELVLAYRALKADEEIAEFSDQMAAGARLAIECPEVGLSERARFKAVLLDEYQDTSVSQRRMLQGLFSGGPGQDGRGHAVTAVGDPCQAIYGWRGASVDNIDDFGVHFPQRDGMAAPTYPLMVNRRCAVRVLEAVNRLAGPLYAAHQGAEQLCVRAGAPQGGITLALHESVVDEIAWAPGAVRRMRADLSRTGPPARWSDIAVLVRNRAELAELTGALRRSGIPAEVVGLSGLLSQPEVADVVATLRVVCDLTANAALLRLLTGPRWRVGVRDLALLGERSEELVRGGAGPVGNDLAAALDAAVVGIDPSEVASLSDALADPGDKAYSPQARARFAVLAAELSMLRRAAGEPLSDLVRRVVLTLGLDVELAASSSPDAHQAADNVALLLETVADFAAHDPFASVHGLVAYLDAEALYNRGMTLAEPSGSDSVKLLTVHAAKGLEWRGVLLPFLSARVFPSAKARSRWQWSAQDVPWPLRGDRRRLPVLAQWSTRGINDYSAQCREHAELEERRLVYVAVTRAKELLVGSGHWWGRTQATPRGPSPYLLELHGAVDPQTDVAPWHAEAPVDGSRNPVLESATPVRFPGSLDEDRIARRQVAADAVRAAMDEPTGPLGADRSPESEEVRQAVRVETGLDLAALDSEIAQLVNEAEAAARGRVQVELPPSLSTTTVQRLRDDPAGLARDLARPMPRLPSPAARFGTRFHSWVESHVGQQSLLDPADLPGRADTDITDHEDLELLKKSFAEGPFGDRVPHAVEAGFTLLLAGQVVTGRIDAVYPTADGFEVIDWKTGRRQDADPLQLAIYRLAWAEMHGLPLQAVSAGFYYVRDAEVVRPAGLPDRAGIEELFRRAAG